MNVRSFSASLFLLLAIGGAGSVYAIERLPTRQELIDSCMARYEQSRSRSYETQCLTYGNKTECETKEGAHGYDPHAVHLASQCAEEAIEKIRTIGAHTIRQSWTDISSSLSHAESVPKGEKIRWGSPSNQTFGTVEAIREGRNSKNLECRQFKISAYIVGEWQAEVITACLNKEGWTPVE